jgi:membrane protein implicated in regulation of membrane protease activity
MSILHVLTPWHWWVLAILLVILEVFSPGIFLLWLGIASAIVGVGLWFWPDLGWQWQLLGFALLSILSILLARTYLSFRPIKTDRPNLNRRGEQYIDRTFTLETPIINGFGKIKVDDSIWKVEGLDAVAGTRVRVIGVDGALLKVETAN